MYPRGTDEERGRGYSLVLLESGIRCGEGAIGAVKPDRWLCTLWDCDTVIQTESLSDVIGRRPTMLELALDAVNHPERWRSVATKT